jgi:hypothetical protein
MIFVNSTMITTIIIDKRIYYHNNINNNIAKYYCLRLLVGFESGVIKSQLYLSAYASHKNIINGFIYKRTIQIYSASFARS